MSARQPPASPVMDQQQDPEKPLVSGVSRYSLRGRLKFNFSPSSFCMYSSLRCSDILIPPLNPPQHIYLKELITSLSSLLVSPPHFNNQRHGNTVYGLGWG